MPENLVRVVCLCKSVQLAAQLPARKIGHCHCHNCQRAQGAGVWTWASFPVDRVRVSAGESDLVRYVSDTEATRSFCRICGSSLSYESPRWPGVIDLSLANMLDPLGAEPTHHVYADRSPEWCPIVDDLPRFGGPTGMQPL